MPNYSSDIIKYLVRIREDFEFGGKAVTWSVFCFGKVAHGKSWDWLKGMNPISEHTTNHLNVFFPKPFNTNLNTLTLKNEILFHS